MKTIELFYLENCPYCINAKRALEELKKKNPEYSGINVKWIEESRESELAKQYDYYYVPTIFYNGNKLYEAHPSEDYEEIKNKIDHALQTIAF